MSGKMLVFAVTTYGSFSRPQPPDPRYGRVDARRGRTPFPDFLLSSHINRCVPEVAISKPTAEGAPQCYCRPGFAPALGLGTRHQAC